MADKPIATLGGKALLGSSAVQWVYQEGTKPVIDTFDMVPSDALQVATPAPVELRIVPLLGNPVVVKNLSVLNVAPGDSPFISKVTVADRRWRWSLFHLVRRFNIRRHIGVKRIIANDQIAVNFDRAPQVAYWEWSKNPTTKQPWTARDALEDVLKAIQDKEKKAGLTTFTYVIDERIGAKLRNLPFEEVVLDDSADQALDRLLHYFPETRLRIDRDGNVVIFSKASGGEDEVIKAMLPEIQERGHVDLVKNNLIRPKEIHVLFTREVELRFDFLETSGTTVTDMGNERLMENVAPIPDYQLTVSGRVLPQGTYEEMTALFNAWGNLPLVGGSVPLTHLLVQRAFVPQMDLWAAMGMAGDLPDERGDLKNWTGRIAAIQNNYRRTFRLNRLWMDRILSMRAYRLSTIDPQSGQRGPATAHGDYSVMYTQRSIWRNSAQGKPLDYCINHSAYPTGSGTIPPLDSTSEASPAIVSIPDHDQGIIHVDYVIDPNRVYEMILPSQIVAGSMPTANIAQRARNISFDAIIRNTNPPRLSPSFKLAIVISVIPASPNTEQQLHKIVVKPDEISDLLPNVQRAALNDCQGPPMEIRIGANVEVARVQWLDSRKADIEKIFGLPVGVKGDPDLTGLVINEGTNKTDLATGASLNAIARAKAAAIYGSLVDRYEGTMTGHMNGKVDANGWIDQVIHRLEPSGDTVTSIAMAETPPQFDLMSFLDSNARQAILRLVQPL